MLEIINLAKRESEKTILEKTEKFHQTMENKKKNTEQKIAQMRKELDEAEKLKVEAKNLLSNYENKIDKSKKEVLEIINLAKKDSEKTILEKTEKFHQIMENKKKNAEQKIAQMKENALRDIKNISVKISMDAVEHLIKNSIDKNKLEKFYTESLAQVKTSLKHIKV